MRVDLYTKAMLTVIATALVYLCVAVTPIGTPVAAQPQQHVVLAGYLDDGTLRTFSSQGRGVPVAVVASGVTGRPAAALPPVAPPPTASAAPRALTSPSRSATRVQCQATTKKGTQCSRMANAGASYCWQHGGEE